MQHLRFTGMYRIWPKTHYKLIREDRTVKVNFHISPFRSSSSLLLREKPFNRTIEWQSVLIVASEVCGGGQDLI